MTGKQKNDLEEIRTGASVYYDYGSENKPNPKKKKKYIEPVEDEEDQSKTFKDEMESDESEDMELEELSSMAGGSVAGYSLPLGAKPKFKKKKK